MERAEALTLIQQKVKNKNLIKHMLAAEAIMKKLAEYFGEDVTVWGLAGLVHDLDYDLTLKAPKQHGRLGAQMLKEAGAAPEIIQAVLSHGPCFSQERETLLEIAIFAADPLSGLIVAATLIHPKKKLAALQEVAESQFPYVNLYTVGLVKTNGVVVNNVDALIEKIGTYL